MAKSNRVGPIPFEVLESGGSAAGDEFWPSGEGQLPAGGLHLPPIEEFRVRGTEEDLSEVSHNSAGKTITAGATAESSATDTTTTETDLKGIPKRFVRYSNSWISSAGNPVASGSHLTGDKGELLAYFQELTFSSDDIDFAAIDHFLENGSDINATCESTGGNIMHEVAAHWDKSVAEYLVQRGLDIHQRDREGRTPLHVAASTNHVEIIEWLADQEAQLEARTLVEKQTPLHHAARYDSVQAMRILMDKGGDSEVVDYKGRTALHLAAELDRTAAVECLISAPILADVRVQDDVGTHAIASMIRTMPQVALAALDQLHRVAPAKRKQYFLLNHLEPEPGLSSTKGVKTPFEVAVEEKRRNVLSHPVMKTLIAQKWKFMQWMFYGYLALYFLFLLSWTLLIAFPSVQQKHEYEFPKDIWRIVVEFIAVSTYLLQIVEEVIEVVLSKNKFKDYRKLRTKSLQDDLSNLGPGFIEERQFFESEIHKLKKKRSSYFTDPWNFIDLVTYVLMFALILLHIIDIFFHSTTFATWVARVSCFVVLLIWLRLFKHARGFLILGPLVAIINQSLGDIIRYFTLYAILFVPYVVCFWVLFGGSQSTSLSADGREDLTMFHRVAIMIFRMGLVDEYPYSSLRSIDEAMAAILVLTFLVFLAVVGLNLFIALLSDTFQRVYDNAQSIALLEQAKLILSYEEKMCACFINRYLIHIHKNCSPHAEFYDDDERYSKESSSEVRKITHQIHTIVSEMRSRQQNNSDHNISELRGVSEVFADCTDQQEDKLALITQQLEELKTLVEAGRSGPAQPAEAPTGYIPTSFLVPGSTSSTSPPMAVHRQKGKQAQPRATAAASTSVAAPLVMETGATPLSPPSHPHTSPTRTALHNIFSQREQVHLKGLHPAAAPARKHSFVPPLAMARPAGNLPSALLGRSESAPGTEQNHRRAQRTSIQEMEDMQWEKKSQPRQRKNNIGT